MENRHLIVFRGLYNRDCFYTKRSRPQALPGVNTPRLREGSVRSAEIAVSKNL